MVHGIFRVSVKSFYHGKAIIKFRTCGYQAWPCTPQGDIDNE